MIKYLLLLLLPSVAAAQAPYAYPVGGYVTRPLPAPAVPTVKTPVDSTQLITVYYGVVMDPARRQLDSLWTNDAHQIEQGYCVGAVSYLSTKDYDENNGRLLGRSIIARVWTILPPVRQTGQTPSSIDQLDCGDGQPHVHTHPPTTCGDDEDAKTCEYGGMNAWQCQPSRTDLQTLVDSGDRFAVVQCDRHAFRFYWPSEYRP